MKLPDSTTAISDLLGDLYRFLLQPLLLFLDPRTAITFLVVVTLFFAIAIAIIAAALTNPDAIPVISGQFAELFGGDSIRHALARPQSPPHRVPHDSPSLAPACA